MGLVQTEFIDRIILEEGTWQVVVLISKVVGDYCIVGLMKVF